MRSRFVVLPVLAAAVVFACSTTRTGRSRTLFFSQEYMNELGASAYDEATIGSEYPVITSGPEFEMVQRVGRRIAEASGANYQWEFRLLDAPEVINAFCLPGGKVAVYSGILPVAETEDGLAAIIGHEVAHATEEHGNERMTHETIASVGMTAAQLALGAWSDMDQESQGYVMQALGLGAQYGALLPYSRTHESEADHVGLIYLVRAGYDPHAAPRLWERMAALSPQRPPAFLSTHPDPLERAEALRELIPEVLAEVRGG